MSQAPQGRGGGHSRGAQRGPEPGDGSDYDGGADAATPRDDGNHDGLVLGTRVEGGGEGTRSDAGCAADQGEQDSLGQELDSDVSPGGPQGPAEPDLASSFEDRDDHDVRHSDRPDQQCDRAKTQEEVVEGAL